MRRRQRSAEEQARTGSAIGFALIVFMAGVLVPSFLGGVRALQIGFTNAAAAERVDRVTDVTLWATALVLSGATVALAALVAMQARRGHVLTSGIVFGLLALFACITNWYVILA
jgi:hypothetical protein